MTERLEENLIFSGESESLTAPSVALSMVNVQAENFKGLTFGVSLDSPSMVPKVKRILLKLKKHQHEKKI